MVRYHGKNENGPAIAFLYFFPEAARGSPGEPMASPGDSLRSSPGVCGKVRELPGGVPAALSSAREAFLQTYKIIKKPLIFTLKVNMEVSQNTSIRTKKSSTRPLQPVGHPKKVCGDS